MAAGQLSSARQKSSVTVLIPLHQWFPEWEGGDGWGRMPPGFYATAVGGAVQVTSDGRVVRATGESFLAGAYRPLWMGSHMLRASRVLRSAALSRWQQKIQAASQAAGYLADTCAGWHLRSVSKSPSMCSVERSGDSGKGRERLLRRIPSNLSITPSSNANFSVHRTNRHYLRAALGQIVATQVRRYVELLVLHF